ncbi:MAG TPA: carboxylating nicotinate-nucleotide diphosphorylase [Streptosporangiaceae bacterium]|nr:carboxylating nicotinate-nucleotide diphosphorylase [Streptosporangiaceae bacterium]
MNDAPNPDLAGRLRDAGLDPAEVTRIVAMALAEDLAGGTDVTTESVIPASAVARAQVVARADGVVAGLPVAEATFRLAAAGLAPGPGDGPRASGSGPSGRGGRTPGGETGPRQQGSGPPGREGDPLTTGDYPLTIRAHTCDGRRVRRGDVLMTVSGALTPMLRAERTALNLLCHLSGIATVTRHWVDAVGGTGARIRDTRKTLPGLRSLQKYAVRCGGGVNHRMSLSDAALVKDNHVAAAGSVAAAFAAVRAHAGDIPVEVECDTLEQVSEAVRAGAGLILLDNFGIGEMAEAVRVVAGRARLEASGGLSLDSARDVAMTGVDYLAVGALTHSAPALDIGLDLAPVSAPSPGGALPASR